MIKKWTAMLMAVVMLAGMTPVTPMTAQAEETAIESSQEAVQEEEEKTEEATEEGKETEEAAEAVKEDEPAAEIPVPEEESTTEISTKSTNTDSTVSDSDTEAASESEDTEVSEEEQKEERGVQPEELEHAKIVQLGASDSRTIYSDGSWSGGTVWYVHSGSSKHYVFCLEKGKTMYSGRYSGDITTGYSGKSAFKKAVALNYFYKSNGSSWSGKKNYGIAQEIIWDQNGSDTAAKLTTYINHAWNLTDLNSGRKSGSGTFSTLLTPVSTSSDRKTMIAGIKKIPVQLNEPVDGVCTDKITLFGRSWKYFAKGGYSGTSSDISVVGIFDDNGNAVTGSYASVDTSGNLNLKVTPDTDKGDSKEHPLTVVMSVKFDYQGSNSIRYVKTADGKQNLTYDASFNTDAYFAIQVFSDIPDYKKAKVNINKEDEYGNFVSGCTFRLTGVSGEAKDNEVDSGNVIIVKPTDCFEIEYPGEYQIVETDAPSEYALNTTPFTFTAERTDDNKIVLSASWISDDGSMEMVIEEPSFTYTCINQFNEGAAELVKTGNALVGYDKASGKFVYEQRKLEGVKFAFYAAEDIYANEELVFSAGEEITNNRYWGGKYNILNPRYHRVKISGKEVYERNEFGLPVTNVYTASNGELGISGLPAGDYYCVETVFLPGFSRIPKKYDFTVEPGKTVQINGTSGILNEQAPADCHVYKVDADTNQPLSGGVFTIYADVANTNYDGKAIFQKSDTVPVVVKRNLFSGKETTEEGVWVPVQKITTGADGMAEFEDLPAGRYLVAETKAPEGYALAEETYIFNHSYDAEQGSSGYNFEHTFKDSRVREYKILKHAETAVPADSDKINADVYIFEDQPIAGVQFGIYAAEDIYNTLGEKVAETDSQIGTCTTDAEGIAGYSGHLFAGDYYFKELQTADADRYMLDDTKYSFTVSSYMTDGSLNDSAIVNKLYKGSIKVIKTDGRTKAPLSDVRFQLLDDKENVLGTYKTDKKGEILIKNLPVGTYSLKETKTKEGYQLDDTVQEIVISKDNLNQVAEFKNYRNKTSITVKTDTTIKGGGSVRTGDLSHMGFIMVLFLLSSAGAAYFSRKRGFKQKKISVKGKKFILVFVLMAGILVFGGLTVRAAAGLKEMSNVELKDTEYNGTIYEYTLQKQYETSNPDEKIDFEEKLDGNLKLDAVTYDIIDTILQKRTLEESKDYKELLEKDESKIPKAVNVEGETYNLDHITWSEEPNMEHVSYTQDYGYAASEPEHSATYEYTYTSPVTGKENTVTLPFARMEQGEYGWVDGFTATVTFRNLEGLYFTLGNHEFAYNADKLSLTQSDYTELVKMLGYNTTQYRLNSASWSGKAYKGKNGELYRDAKASGQQYAAPFKAVYEDDVENGKIYTVHATYSCEVEVPAEEATPTYVMQATAYYRKQTIPLLVSVGVVILIILVIAVLYTISRKQKKVSSNQNSTNVQG